MSSGFGSHGMNGAHGMQGATYHFQTNMDSGVDPFEIFQNFFKDSGMDPQSM